MKPLHQIAAILAAAVTAAAVGCAAPGDEPWAAHEEQIRPLERRAIGRAAPYEADLSLRDQLPELESSIKARRAAAWKAVARVLRPVAIADASAGGAGEAPTLPLFRTWYGKDDFERMFGKAYGELSPAERRERRPLTRGEVESLFDWNARSLGASSEEDYFERIAQVDDREALDGLGGNHRVVYSPGLLGHLFEQYGHVSACSSKLDTFGPDDAPPSPTNFAPCFDREFPEDAAVVKTSWSRASFGQERFALSTYDTSADALAGRMSGETDRGGWGKGTGKVDPDDASIYTVKLSDGTRFRMPAMHLVTKELRDWLWITLWWSDTPDEDFGADRPEEITALGGPWASYKMNVVVSYEERDPDPRGGFDGSLGDALEAAYTRVGGASWASNPYLERGEPNAQTNCVGCHQHAGTRETSESVLASPERFPEAGRTKVRQNFPADYLFALTSAPERLAGVIDDRVRHHDIVDR